MKAAAAGGAPCRRALVCLTAIVVALAAAAPGAHALSFNGGQATWFQPNNA
jgi:hypothetical protein